MQSRSGIAAGRRTAFTLLLLVAAPVPSTTVDATLEAQRAAFRDVYPAAELGQWDAVAAREALLRDYVLWPDLKAAWLRRHLDDDKAVTEFLDAYQGLRPAKDIRYRYARRLAAHGRYADYLNLYDAHYVNAGDPVLDCRAAQALVETGESDRALGLARRLWLVGRSQVDECDDVFAWMRSSGRLTTELISERYRLAVEAQDFSLARYLARSLGEGALAAAERWLRARSAPETFLETADISRIEREYHEQLAYAARRLARRDPEAAYRHWSRLRADIGFDPELETPIARDVALWAARRNLDNAEGLLARLDAAAIDDEVRRWRIRNALREQRWQDVLRVVDELSEAERNQEEWQFWAAMAMEHTGRSADAMLIMSTLARQRSYYGFLAADHLGIDYHLDSEPVVTDEVIIARLQRMPELERARELYLTGLDGRARSEWDDALRNLDDETQAQAAVLAERWGWHSRAMAMAARAGRLDSLELRYPLAHRDEFRRAAETAGIPESWAFGVARSESIFMRDVRSSAGAVGLMQLMPATGQRTARQIRLPYRGLNTLTDPESNIRLGTTYLALMRNRFQGHAALATAAYNAGPSRVEQWLPEKATQDAKIWVETIPFNETRDYVRRVLTAEVIFAWRLTGDAPRISERLQPISPPRTVQSAAVD
ncbi:MAG: transglycosylase SLT domain-containing protein [Woeseiaceae bacterium]|nr:transglycosylase SLT domain-containing protein [Woeseiaceae bacterium]